MPAEARDPAAKRKSRNIDQSAGRENLWQFHVTFLANWAEIDSAFGNSFGEVIGIGACSKSIREQPERIGHHWLHLRPGMAQTCDGTKNLPELGCKTGATGSERPARGGARQLWKGEVVASKSKDDRMARIVASAEDHFGQEVQRVTAPGGEGRSSFRLHFADREVIATLRPNFRRTHLEAFVLESLSAHCDVIPRSLGVDGEILFQSDVGRRRLNQEIARHGPEGQMDLAAQAVAAIFRFQSAARKTALAKMLPHLGANDDWIANFVHAVDALQPYSGGIPAAFDRDAASRAVAQPGRQFVKWDCRSGNAAIGADDRLRWFDFEYSGMRHGAEDFAWLIGDEAWPIAPEDMVDVMIDAFDPDCGHDIAAYLDYLSVYLTFHAVQRFKLIVKEAKKRGWLSKERVRKYDDAGVHPEFAVQILRVGRYFSAQSRITAPLTRNLDTAMHAFEEILRDGRSLKRA